MVIQISKAFLLAAGLGTRLRPLTNGVPKCLVPIRGKPLLNIWLDICEQLGISEVLINTHHLAESVRSWARKQESRVKIHLAHEEVLRGSAGTVAANRDFIGGGEHFYVFYADNLVHVDLDALKAFHFQHKGVLSLGLFQTPQPGACGIVTLDENARITSFEEKPLHPKSNLANAGIYIARRELFDYLPSVGCVDFGKDVMPGLLGKMWGLVLDGYIRDVGTPENYRKAWEEWPAILRERAPRGVPAGMGRRGS